MADFTLEPDDLEAARPDRARAARLVSTGLTPTAAIPPATRTKEPPPCYVPCEAWGALVLTGCPPTGPGWRWIPARRPTW